MKPIEKSAIFFLISAALLALWQIFAKADALAFVMADTQTYATTIAAIVAISLIPTLPSNWKSALTGLAIVAFITFFLALARAKGWYAPSYKKNFWHNFRLPALTMLVGAMLMGVLEKKNK